MRNEAIRYVAEEEEEEEKKNAALFAFVFDLLRTRIIKLV